MGQKERKSTFRAYGSGTEREVRVGESEKEGGECA